MASCGGAGAKARNAKPGASGALRKLNGMKCAEIYMKSQKAAQRNTARHPQWL